MRDTDNEEGHMEAIARAVAAAMPGNPPGSAWALKLRDQESTYGPPEDADQTITRAVDGLEIVLSRWKDYRGSREKRITVRGVWPRDAAGQVHTMRDSKTFEITVGAKYRAEYIAKEISRRFLPRWEEALRSVLAECKQYDDHQARKEELAGELARILGEDQTAREKENGEVRFYWGGGATPTSVQPCQIYGSFHCGSGVRLELSIDDRQLAKEIAVLLVRYRGSAERAERAERSECCMQDCDQEVAFAGAAHCHGHLDEIGRDLRKDLKALQTGGGVHAR